MGDFPQLSARNEKLAQEDLYQWSLANGLVMYPPDFSDYSTNIAPVTLFPTPIPKEAFERAIDVQKLFNEIYAKMVSTEKSWFADILKELGDADKRFTGKLLQTYDKAVEESGGKLKQPLSLGLFRSDYMVNQTNVESTIKQIEFNTVSISFGGLSTKVGELHNFLNTKGVYDNDYSYEYYQPETIPISNSANELAEGLADGNFYYNGQTQNKKTAILFIIQDKERNSFDQRHIEYALLKNHGIKSFRVTLIDVESTTTVNGGKLYMKSTMDEISVIYYRAGYAPSEYDNDKAWGARLYLEKTEAIKCPSLRTQLAGSKKIQQLLTDKELLSKYISGEDSIEKVLSTFVSIYPLDDSEKGKAAKKLITESPGNFVLKPQREGGGNNVYKEDIPGFLKQVPEKDWSGYILMELINPPSYLNKIVRDDKVYSEPIISELGIFGTTVFNEDTSEILTNKNAGWLLRSKFNSSNEGGVSAGFGCVDNIHLV